jgi:hypothetical protein
MEFLAKQRIPSLIKRTSRRGDRISLFAGAFTVQQRDAAERLAERLRLMTVQGRKEFKDAQVIPVR